MNKNLICPHIRMTKILCTWSYHNDGIADQNLEALIDLDEVGLPPLALFLERVGQKLGPFQSSSRLLNCGLQVGFALNSLLLVGLYA